MVTSYGAPSGYERRLMLGYLCNVARLLRHSQTEARDLAGWVFDHQAELRLGEWHWSGDVDAEMKMEFWECLRDLLRDALRRTARTRVDAPGRRLRRLGRELDLSGTDVAILELLLRYQTRAPIQSMVDTIFQERRRRSGTNVLAAGQPALPALLGMSVAACFTRLESDAPLIETGMVIVDRHESDLTVIGRLERLVRAPQGHDLTPQQLLFDASPAGDLEWSDFEHVARHRDHVESLLKGALEARERGINILLYGPPGSGKTEFCRTLGRRLGVNLLAIGESDDDIDEPRRQERLGDLKLAQSLCARGNNTVLLFDEMEDLLGGDERMWPSGPGKLRAGGSRVFLNRVLEETPVPVLWTTNAADHTSAAILRRMIYALEMPRPGARVRTRIWSRHLARHGIHVAEEEIHSLARDYETTPAVPAAAARAAHLAGRDDIDAVRQGVASLSRLLYAQRPPQSAPARYDVDLVHADINLQQLAERLTHRGKYRCSLCLQGPPGTGKSAYARHLAERMGLELVQKRASDLMSKWVGQTEQRIAAAFQEAREQELFLVFDEAESLLSDRRFAQSSWEVTQVNEMLTWMESHPLPFACTTNYQEHMDPATLRRFDFKIAFDFLAPEQVQTAFRTYFGLEPTDELKTVGGLTPGDFAVVRRKADVLDRLHDAQALAGMLRAECEAKPDRPRPIGFLRQ